MKKFLLALSLTTFSLLNAINNNVELIGNSDFSIAALFTDGPTNFADNAIKSKWYAGGTDIANYNTTGFQNSITSGAFDAIIPADATVYNNFLGQVTTELLNTGRYRISVRAKGTAPLYLKISSTGAMGTELTYTLRNASSAAIEKQSTLDFSGYSLKITPTADWETYSADLDLTNATASTVRLYFVFPKTGTVSVDDISLKRTKDIPTVYYIRPSDNTTAWTTTTGVDPDQIITSTALSLSGTNIYYFAAGNYTTTGITITTGKIYGGFSGDETSIDPSTRPVSDLDANGIIEPWEFTNETSIKSSVANSSFTGTGVTSRLLVVSGNGGEVNGVTLSDYYMITYGGAISLGKPATTPAAADTVSTLAGTLRFCTVKMIKSALAGSVVSYNPYSLIDRCLIESTVNGAGNSGGAINLYGFGGLVEGCVIRNNVSSAASGRGGGIAGSVNAAAGNTGTIRNCVIYNNTASVGGAIRIDGVATKRGVQIINCTIANNVTTGGSSVELIASGSIVNSIVVNPSLAQAGAEIRASGANSYITNVVYGDSTYTAGGIKSTTMRPKTTGDFGFTNATTFSGVSIPNYTTPWNATALANYNAIRQANFKLSGASSPALSLASAKTLPVSYTYTGGTAISFTATIPTTDLFEVERPISTNGHLDLGAYQFSSLNTGVIGNIADSGVKIYSLNNGVNISGAKGQMANVYNFSGQLVKSEFISTENSVLKINKGLYIVKVGLQVNKVSVK